MRYYGGCLLSVCDRNPEFPDGTVHPEAPLEHQQKDILNECIFCILYRGSVSFNGGCQSGCRRAAEQDNIDRLFVFEAVFDHE